MMDFGGDFVLYLYCFQLNVPLLMYHCSACSIFVYAGGWTIVRGFILLESRSLVP